MGFWGFGEKWWIVPLTMLLGLTLMFLQESDLQTSPRYFSLTKAYEPLDEAGPLSIVALSKGSKDGRANIVECAKAGVGRRGDARQLCGW